MSEAIDKDTCLVLASGAKMPQFGLGTWQILGEDVERAVGTALDLGYRLIDTAYSYHNEEAIGKVLGEHLKTGQLRREDVFITTKLPGIFKGTRETVRIAFERSLKALGLDYIDLYLIHSPMGFKLTKDEAIFPVDDEGRLLSANHDFAETWKAMEELVDEGRVRSLGLSNFNSEQIQRICNIARYPVSNLQVECNAYLSQQPLFHFCQQRNITFTSFASLGSPGRVTIMPAEAGDLLTDKLILSLAKKYNKSPAQILLRNLVQRGIAVIPKSTSPMRIKENIEIFDFTLSEKEMADIAELNRDLRYFHFKFIKGIEDHPEYPFNSSF